MVEDWLSSGDATVYIVPKVKKKFDEELKRILEEELGNGFEPVRLGQDLSDWVVSRVNVRKWSKGRGKRSPSTKALSRAFQALAAARYHLRGDSEAELKLRELRDQVEALWLADRKPPEE